MNFRKVTNVILLTATLGGGLFLVVEKFTERADEGMSFDQTMSLPVAKEERVIADALPVVTEAVPASLGVAKPKSWQNVFFTSQAPTGEWAKSEFQNGCEEASVLMVQAWRTGKVYTKGEARDELVAMARYQEKRVGQGVDTDIADTAQLLLAGYFDITDYTIVYDFTRDDLKRALVEGLVIVPTNGQALKNPNFTRPGPLQHMLVVTGYDAAMQEFITNDPGTRKGQDYRYPEQTLFDAIREYPTGKHFPIETERKTMIVIPSSVDR